MTDITEPCGTIAAETGETGADAARPTGENEPVLYTKRGTPIYDTDSRRDAADTDTDSEKEFNELISGRFKKDYDRAVSKIVTARLKGARNAEAALERVAPIIEQLAKAHGVDPENFTAQDIQRLVSELPQTTDKTAVQAAQDGELRARFDAVVSEAEKLRGVYPSFDFSAEMNDPRFARLVAVGVPVRTAFEVCHKDELISSAMRYTAKRISEKMTADMMRGAVPRENGITSHTPAVTGEDIRSKEYREKIKSRVRKGERVVI